MKYLKVICLVKRVSVLVWNIWKLPVVQKGIRTSLKYNLKVICLFGRVSVLVWNTIWKLYFCSKGYRYYFEISESYTFVQKGIRTSSKYLNVICLFKRVSVLVWNIWNLPVVQKGIRTSLKYNLKVIYLFKRIPALIWNTIWKLSVCSKEYPY